jgi:hypothetical protein
MTPPTPAIEVEHDVFNDLLIARPRWTLITRQDVEAWHAMWIQVLKPFRKKIDLVIVLDDFRVSGEAAMVWGEARADLDKHHFGLSYRVHSSVVVRVGTLTSGVTYNAATAEAPTVELAVEGIKTARLAAAQGSSSTPSKGR